MYHSLTADFRSMQNCQIFFSYLYLLALAGWDPKPTVHNHHSHLHPLNHIYLFLFIMADTPASDGEPAGIDLSVVACLTFYKAGAMGKGKKQTKDVKAKTFNHNFFKSKDNYLELLMAILEKHHVDKKHKVTARNVFPCKIQVYPAKYVSIVLTIPVPNLLYDI